MFFWKRHSQIVVHPKTFKDWDRLYLDHLLRLDDESRENRFICHMTDDAIRTHVQRYRPDWAIAEVVSGVWRGVVEVYELGNGRCEVALSVEKPFQGKGHGRAMLENAARIAARRHIREIELIWSTHNVAMGALARKEHARTEMLGDGMARSVLDPATV